jgi:hypothetical protein
VIEPGGKTKKTVVNLIGKDGKINNIARLRNGLRLISGGVNGNII